MNSRPDPRSSTWAGSLSDAPGSFAEARSLKRELLEELRAGWDQGAPSPPEDLLRRWPGDPKRDPDVASLLFEDYWQRQQRGGQASVRQDEYEERFPDHRDSLQGLFRSHALLNSMAGSGLAPSGGSSLRLALPSVGDELFDFRLRRELGRGAFARVFLAEQAGLADRPVVVKVSAIDGDEPQTLAQLQHTNIVPIYSVHEDARAGLRVVCMPYFGGDSLSRLLRALWTPDTPPRTGAQLVAALARTKQKTEGVATAPAGQDAGPLAELRTCTFIQAAVWLTARLAEALQHAHDRGIFHRDIKPSNILLAADGQPMLLDFNLAQQTRNAQAAATLGGTVAYMAPEHLRALAGRDPALARWVDHRADLYSLGMVLFEMLAGQSPFDQSASYSPVPALIEAMAVERSHTTPSLRRQRPEIPWSLESILRKCLAPEPAQRYQQARDLAEDLQRFLEDRPLRHAPELSWRERIRKWTRRHPRLTTSGSITAAAVAVLLTISSVLMGTRSQLAAALDQAERGELAQALQLRDRFLKGHERALCLAQTTTNLVDHVRRGLDECRSTLAFYHVLDRADWQTQRSWQRLSAEDRARLLEDVRELLLLQARAESYLASPAADLELARGLGASLLPFAGIPFHVNSVGMLGAGSTLCQATVAHQEQETRALRHALALVDQAEALSRAKASAALWEDRALYLGRLGEAAGSAAALARAKGLPPVSMRDHYELARTLFFNGRYPEAVVELQRALDLNPRHYWSLLLLGLCHEKQHDLVEALADYSQCVAVWPEFAWGFFNRSVVLDELGRKIKARSDLTMALRLDPNFTYAYLNRGVIALNLGQPREALADLDRAAALGYQDGRLYACRGIALEQLGRHVEADQAFALAWQREPNNADLRLGYAFAVFTRLPATAETVFAQVLQADRRNVRALYGLGMLATRRSRDSQEALMLFTRALEIDPSFLDARRGRANVLAHQGQWAWARQDIDWCVKLEPSGQTLYAGACVYALIAQKGPDELQAQAAGQHALLLLRAALEKGYGADRAATDEDLVGIREEQEFEWLVAGEW
jgi:serine/threonine protein kinase/tetratricopeptide (TPR) repeat protein